MRRKQSIDHFFAGDNNEKAARDEVIQSDESEQNPRVENCIKLSPQLCVLVSARNGQARTVKRSFFAGSEVDEIIGIRNACVGGKARSRRRRSHVGRYF